jgi:hypothetical protein
VVEARRGGVFDRIEDLISHGEMAGHAATCKQIAGFRAARTNAASRTVPQGAQFSAK